MTKSYPGINTGVLHLDDYWNYETLSTEDKKEFNWKASGGKHDKYDTKVDLYQFSFLNYSGRFVIIKEDGILVPKFVSKSHHFKIELNYNTNYVISGFVITDKSGYKHTFNSVEVTTSSPVSGSVLQGESGGSISSLGASQDYHVNSAWHLTNIKTSNDKVLVTLNYTTDQESYTTSINRTENEVIVDWDYPSYTSLIAIQYNRGILKPKRTVSYFQTNASTKKIASIVFRDSTKVLFDIKPNSIHPETNGDILEKIRMVDENGIENKQYQLNYEQTTDVDTTPISHRLWLTELVESTGVDSNIYQLNYNSKENLPGFDSSKSDDWGYYSGIELTSLACAGINNVYHEDMIKTGLIKSIVYPTGGVTEFEFEHNGYSYYGNDTIARNEYLKNPNNSTAISETASFSYQNPQQAVTMPRNVDAITLDFEQDVYLNGYSLKLCCY